VPWSCWIASRSPAAQWIAAAHGGECHGTNEWEHVMLSIVEDARLDAVLAAGVDEPLRVVRKCTMARRIDVAPAQLLQM